MAVLLLTERRISAFGRSPAHPPAARPRKYRQIAHARTRAAVLMEDPLLPIAKPYLTQVLLVLLLRDRSLPQVDLQNLEPRDSRKPGGAAAGEAAPGGASRRNSGGVGQLPYCGGRVRSRIHVVWLLSLLVSGPTTNTSCPFCISIPPATETDTDSMWAGVRP